MFRLALAAGGDYIYNPELLLSMPAQTWMAWEQFLEYEHVGGAWDDWRAGMIASTIANANRDPKKRKKPFAPQDFIPKHTSPPRAATPQELAEKLRAIKRAHGRST
jgi:hypothetical protein